MNQISDIVGGVESTFTQELEHLLFCVWVM